MFALREFPNKSNNYSITPYDQRLQILNLTSIRRKHVNSAIIFMYDVLHNNVHCPNFKNEINCKNSSSITRNRELFYINDRALRITLTTPISIIFKLANAVSDLILNSESRISFKSSLHKLNDDELF